MSNDRPNGPLPNWQDWLLLTINIVFVVMALIILPRNRDVGIVTLVLFGTCLVVSAGTILRKFRFRRFSGEKVGVAGGVPIRVRTGKMLLGGAWLTGLGTILVVFGQDYPFYFCVLAGSFAVVGALFFLAAFAGIWPGGYLQFDPDYLTIAERKWQARIPWEDIEKVSQAECNSNPLLLLFVRDLTCLDIAPPDELRRATTAIARTRQISGADFSIMTDHYGIDLPVLKAAITRYVNDVSARAALRPQLTYKDELGQRVGCQYCAMKKEMHTLRRATHPGGGLKTVAAAGSKRNHHVAG